MPSPIVNATFQATILSSISNILAQFVEAHQEKRPFAFDLLAFVRFVIITVITCPPNYLWQQWLERAFPGRKDVDGPGVGKNEDGIEMAEQGKEKVETSHPQRKSRLNIRNTATKWFIDCITLGALFNTVAFLLLANLLKGHSLDLTMRAIRYETIPIIVASYKVWPIASVVNFSLIPVEKRIVFLSAVGLCWGIYMSLVAVRQ
ncbi:MAG: hypothetical protein M1821_004389 [Bathelium mastoideum]|nr:MAG: hypothetical protein M1821_004389 [Bathelium mastoideum]KAI9685304.1 MAG: hypothetical protein M1822_004677 [Bathelium mastoideum]